MNDGNGLRCAISLSLIMLFCLSCSPSNQGNEDFEYQRFSLADYGLFDLGVVDMNDDNRLDIFTANHSAEQSFMLNNGSGSFTDVYASWNMDQDHQFPGLAILPKEIPGRTPGVFIDWVGPDVVLRTRQLGKETPFSGRIEVFTSVKNLKKKNIRVTVTEKAISPAVAHSLITFAGQGDGEFRFRPYNHALPFAFHFDASIPADMIHIGKNRITPATGDFEFMLRDRHGMAWSDFNDDAHMDVFITRGGEKGLMGQLPMPFFDELYFGTPSGMEEVGVVKGLAKNGCSGRQAGLVDYDGNGLLDIYVVCGRGSDAQPNMLFKQTDGGHFEEVAAGNGLAIGSVGSFVWLDVDHDADMDLVWADINGHFLYLNENGKFSPIPLEFFNRTEYQRKLTLADYNSDGWLDIFSAGMSGNVLYANSGGTLSAVLPASVGLPDKSMTANWVDFDNDGLMDLHAVPQGVFVQQPSGKFVNASLLALPGRAFSPFRPVKALATWFDMDNNGTRDLLLATQWRTKNNRWAKWLVKAMKLDRSFGGLGYYWETALFNNQKMENHWLQVQLTGPPGNRQAVGARVTLETRDGQQVQQVGQADGSDLSMGHYRLYFGLGRNLQLSSLQVAWPDGQLTQFLNPTANQLMKIAWQESR